MQAEHRERMHQQKDLRIQMEQIEKLHATPLEAVLEVTNSTTTTPSVRVDTVDTITTATAYTVHRLLLYRHRL
jgi:hypothetical protein